LTAVLNPALAVMAALILWPMLVVAVQCALALLPSRRKRDPSDMPDPEIVVLMPAHDEERVIGRTLSLLRERDGGQRAEVPDALRILVVADNCGDRTAAVARAEGAEVVERHDRRRVGKGYALDHGIRHLAGRPPDVVVVVDADCRIDRSAIRLIARRAVCAARPVQAAYLMTLPERHGPRHRISALAFLIKNIARPRGWDRLGLPCALTGTGMAFPWSVIAGAPLASGNIVEDLQLGLDLALAGTPPVYCHEALVTSRLPEAGAAQAVQRTRWEHGHLQTLFRSGPKLILAGLRAGRSDLIAMGVDLAVPPLSLLVLLVLGTAALAAAGTLLGASWVPLAAIAGGAVLFAAAIAASWYRFGRRWIPARSLPAIPFYVLWKIPIYLAFLFRRQRSWVSTVRDPDHSLDSSHGDGDTCTVDLFGINVHNLSFDEAVDRIIAMCRGGEPRYVVTPNVDHVMKARRDERLRLIYERADLSLADGMPLVWAAKILGRPLKDKVSGSDLFEALCRQAARHDLGVFLLGAAPGVAHKAGVILEKRCPGLRIVGTLSPRLDADGSSPDNDMMAARIAEAKPDLLFAAFGSPKQEYWIARHHRKMGVPVVIGVGASFDFVAGVQRRAPRWMQRAGLEWTWRLAHDPRRLWRRYLVDDLPFIKLLAAAVLARAFGRPDGKDRRAGR
jgi:exopolysaccharide biosynthesis WecB/TagA/CpsF family protein